MKIYNEVVIDMNTGETIYEDSYEYDGPMAMCGGKPGNDAEWNAAQDKIDASNALGPTLTSSFQSMQKQFDAMTTLYDSQRETAGGRYDLATNASNRAVDSYNAAVGEGYDPTDPDAEVGGFIGSAWDTAQSQYAQAGTRKAEQGRQAGAAVKAAIRGTGEKSRRAAGKASTMARSQAAKSGLAGSGSQGADLSDLYRDSAMATEATGEGYKKAIFASEDAYETAGYTRDAAELAKDKAVFDAGQGKDVAADALTEAGYARDTAIQNIDMATAQMTGKMEMDIQNMLTSFYSATGTAYGGDVKQKWSGFFDAENVHQEYKDSDIEDPTKFVTGG